MALIQVMSHSLTTTTTTTAKTMTMKDEDLNVGHRLPIGKCNRNRNEFVFSSDIDSSQVNSQSISLNTPLPEYRIVSNLSPP